MNAFIDLSDEEQVMELVQYTASNLPERAGLAEELAALVQEGAARLPEVLRALITSSSMFFERDVDIESFFNSIARLLRVCKPEDTALLVRELATVLSSDKLKGQEGGRLKVLANLFNNLEKGSHSRFDTYVRIVELASSTGNIGLITGQLPRLDAWLEEWACTMEERRALYKQLFYSLKDSGNLAQSCEYVIKFLQTYEEESADSLSTVKNEARALILQVLASPDMFTAHHILGLNAVKQLHGEPAHTLLGLFSDGNLDVYQNFVKSQPDFFASSGLDESAVSRKVRLIALAGKCAAKSSLSFGEIADTLKIGEDQIELWIIDVIRSGLAEAKVDQLNERVEVSRATHAEFTEGKWEELALRLAAWQRNIGEVQRTLDQVKLAVQRQTQQAAGGAGGR